MGNRRAARRIARQVMRNLKMRPRWVGDGVGGFMYDGERYGAHVESMGTRWHATIYDALEDEVVEDKRGNDPERLKRWAAPKVDRLERKG